MSPLSSRLAASIRASFLRFIGFEDANHGSRKESFHSSRPSLPPILVLAVSLWISTALSYELFFSVNPRPQLALILVCALAGGGAVILLVLKSEYACLSCIVLGMSLGVGLSAVEATTLKTDPPEELTGMVVLQNDASEGSYGSHATGLAQTKEGELIRVRLIFPDEARLLSGTTLQACLRWAPITYAQDNAELDTSGATNVPADDEKLVRAWQQGLRGNAYLNSYTVCEDASPAGILREVRLKSIELLNPQASEERGFLAAILFGFREELFNSELYQCLRVDGLAHLAAVSGAHLAIVTALIALILGHLHVRPAISCALELGCIGIYLALTGFPISALRAAFMVTCSLCALLFHRRSYGLGALSFGIIVLILADPLCASSLSFILSVLATLGIILFGGLATEWVEAFIPRAPRMLSESLGVTLASSLLTIPISAAYFSQIALISPLANLFATPLFAVLCPMGLVVVALVLILPAFQWLFVPLDLLTWFSAVVFSSLATLPHASLPASFSVPSAFIIVFAVGVALWWLWPQPTRQARVVLGSALTTLVLIAVLLSTSPTDDEIVMLDVGQGDSFLLRSQNQTILIDTGNEDGALLDALAKQGVHHLDALLITHADDDHCGSMDSLPGIVSVDQVLLSSWTAASGDAGDRELIQASERLVGKDHIRYLSRDAELRWGIFHGRVLGPADHPSGSRNEMSLILDVAWDVDADGQYEGHGLFCGDAEADALSEALQSTDLSNVAIYKVGHHGSKAALSEELVSRLHPQLALVSVGAHNRYGHPRKETLALLEEQNSMICRSDELGDVSCKLRKEGIELTTERPMEEDGSKLLEASLQ